MDLENGLPGPEHSCPAQTTIWYAVLINQVGHEQAQRNLHPAASAM
jgi:hypothetical protein